MDVNLMTVGSGSTLKVSGTVTGLIQGSSDGIGAVELANHLTLNGNIGNATNSLASVLIDSGKNINVGTYTLDATSISMQNNSEITLSSGTLRGIVEGTSAGFGRIQLTGNNTLEARTFLGS